MPSPRIQSNMAPTEDTSEERVTEIAMSAAEMITAAPRTLKLLAEEFSQHNNG